MFELRIGAFCRPDVKAQRGWDMMILEINSFLRNGYRRLVDLLPQPIRGFAPAWTLISFGLSSCLCLVIDKIFFSLVCLPLVGLFGRSQSIVAGVIVARLISGNCNYFFNHKVVFGKAATLRSYCQYWSLVVINLLIAMSATTLISKWADAKGLVITAINLCVDVALFAFSFVMQRYVIFKKGKE